MDGLQIHLLVNHVPIIGTIIGVLVTLLGAIVKADVVKRTGLAIYIATGLFVFAANVSGEEAEDLVEERVSWVSHDQIHEHEEAAETAMTITVIGLILALVHLVNVPPSQSVQRLVLSAFFLAGIAGTIAVGMAGHEGGKIRRPDLGAATTSAPAPHGEHE
ncbi:MAG: hypothetical protein ACO3I4_01895 [Candidatus Kapaibacteriota bacterium]|jgi:uncharacterized membrane protein